MTTLRQKTLSGTVFRVSSLSGFATVLALGWNLLVASYLGVSEAADALFIAFTVPMVLISICTSIGAALVPVFLPSTLSQTNINRLYATIFNSVLLSLLITILIGSSFAPVLISLISPGASGTTTEAATILLRILLPTALFSGLSAILSGMLNAHEKFSYSALSNLVRWSVTLGSTTLLSSYGATGISISWVLGGLIQLTIMLTICRWKKVFRYQLVLDRHIPAIAKAWSLAQTALIGVGIAQIILILEKIIASFLPIGTIAALSYATRITRASGQVLVYTVGQVSLPALSNKWGQNLYNDACDLFIQNLRFITYLTFPLAGIFISLSLPIATVLFQHGTLTELQVSHIATLLAIASTGLFFSGFYEMSLIFLYAQNNFKAINTFYLFLFGGFVVWGGTIGWFGEGRGLALAFPLSLLISGLYGLWVIKIPRLYWNKLIAYLVKLVVATSIMAGTVYVITIIFSSAYEGNSTMLHSILLLVLGLVSGGSMWLSMTMILKIPETLNGLYRVLVWVGIRS